MKVKQKWKIVSTAILISLAGSSVLYAGEVKILGALFKKTEHNQWNVNVTLKHGDIGWDHYADEWRIVDENKTVLGKRVLYHPHVDEQPFTRSLAGVMVPTNTAVLYIEAHDKVHGWSKQRLKVDLSKAVEGVLKVKVAEK